MKANTPERGRTCGEPICCGDCGRVLWCHGDVSLIPHLGSPKSHIAYCESCDAVTNMSRRPEDRERRKLKMKAAAEEHGHNYAEAMR